MVLQSARMIKLPLAITTICVLSIFNSFAQNRAPLRTTFLSQLRNEDASGSVAVQRFDIRGGVPLIQQEGNLIALGARYAFDQYDFEGTTADWDNVNNADVGLAWRWQFSDRWLWANYGALSLGLEESVDFSDGLKFNHISVLEYKWNDHLIIGPGIGIADKINQGITVFPILAFQWYINDGLLFGSGPSDVSATGANIFLEYTPESLGKNWVFTTGVSYSDNTFALANAGSVARSGEERLGSAYGAVSYKWNNGAKLSLIGGYHFFQSFETFNGDGDLLSKEILEDAPYLGVSFGVEF